MPTEIEVSPPLPQGEEMFRVDVEGLRKKFAHCSKNFLLYELYQNAVDEDVRRVVLELSPVDSEHCRLIVEDDSPEGFKDLTHCYTLYAESSKLHNPEQRGIWNLGEKLVLAFCTSAAVVSTKGSVLFQDGLRYHFNTRRPQGTLFDGVILMNPAEYEECCRGVSRLIPPVGIDVWFNGRLLQAPPLLHEFRVTLPTTIGDQDGAISRTRRITTVRVYEPGPGTAAIYEMGIPVVNTHDKWHYDVQQRVPLNMQRDNVTPAYLQELRVAVFNEMHAHLSEDDANADWARACTNDRRCSEEAIKTALDLRFGEDRVAFDPSDLEANKRAVAAGYNVIHGRSLSKMEWANARNADAIRPAGQVTPSPKPYGPDGRLPFILHPHEYTPGIHGVVAYVHLIAPDLVDHDVEVVIEREPTANYLAKYGPGCPLTFNLGRLGHDFFNRRSWEGLEAINALVLHELAHEYEGDHLSDNYYDALSDLGARLASLVLMHPEYFQAMIQTWTVAERRLPRANLN